MFLSAGTGLLLLHKIRHQRKRTLAITTVFLEIKKAFHLISLTRLLGILYDGTFVAFWPPVITSITKQKALL